LCVIGIFRQHLRRERDATFPQHLHLPSYTGPPALSVSDVASSDCALRTVQVASAVANFETTRDLLQVGAARSCSLLLTPAHSCSRPSQVPEKLMSPRRVIVPVQDLKNPGLRCVGGEYS
jgi:hypothetical protein